MKDRKNPNPPRKVRTVVERGYFHTGNSGISISLVEERENYDWDAQDRNWYNHYMEIRHSAHGAGTTVRTPIAGPVGCDYIIDAFTRLRDRMLDDPFYRVPSPFDRYIHDGMQNRPDALKGLGEAHRVSDIENGLQRREKWSEETVVDCYSTSQRLLAHEFVDTGTGHVVRTVPFEFMVERGSSSAGGSPIYNPAAIGKPLRLVEEEAAKEHARLRLNAGIDKAPKADEAIPLVPNTIVAANEIVSQTQELRETLNASIARMNGLMPKPGVTLTPAQLKLVQDQLAELQRGFEDLVVPAEAIGDDVERYSRQSRLLSRDEVIDAYQWAHNCDPGGEMIYAGQNYPLDGSTNVVAVVIADQMTDPENNSNQTIWVMLDEAHLDEFTEQFGQ